MSTRFRSLGRVALLAALLLALALPSLASAAPYPTPYLNGFENPADATPLPSTSDADTMFGVTRVASGTNGVTSADGAWHATAPINTTSASLFTRLGGYQSVFPAGGFSVSVDIYLDTAVAGPTSTQLDWIAAISNAAGAHRRDFVFSIGGNGAGGYVMSASNNSPGWPGNPGRDPYTITTTGWYTFKHVFRDNAGVLAVDMQVLDAGGTLLKSWTLSDPTDTIPANVGGNRYAWLVTNEYADLPLDNVTRSGACTTVCYADAVNGNDANDGITPATAFKTIQKAIDTVQAGGQVRVLPGDYDETATNRDVLGAGSYQFGLFFEETAKDGVSLLGVTAADIVITDPNATEALITTNATNNFGFSGIFVEADDVTIAGVEIGPNTPGENKTIEIIGDNFTLKDSLITGDGADGGYPYVNDWRYDDGTDTAHVERYTFDNNVFGPGSQIAISSGAGASGPVSGRQITGNEFTMGAGQNWPSISFNGDDTTVPWYTYPVGGAVITGNTFTNNAVGGMHIRARGVADDSEFDWASYWNDNTYNKAVVVGPNPPSVVRAWSYTTSYTFNNVRVIGADIQPEVGHGLAGDTVLVMEGVYPENVTIDKSLTLTGSGQTDDANGTVIDGTTLTGYGIYVNANVIDVTIEDLRVEDFAANPSSGIWANGQNNGFTAQNVTVVNNGFAGNSGGGVYMNGPVDDVLIDHVTATGNRTRGIVIWNGFKTDITLTNNTATGNVCCGIELSDGTASGVTATGNTLSGNADNGMAFVGLTSGAGPNLIANNTLTNNGRFGIEIKLPNGTGLPTGDGSIVVEDNTVSMTAPIADGVNHRDGAGIAAFRRGWVAGNNNIDIPTGVIIRDNTVSGYQQTSTSEGFGIVVEGLNMTVTGNTLVNNDVGAQVQGGHLPYTANTAVDGDQSNLPDQFFGRGNSPVGCALIDGNTFTGNTADAREVGTGGMVVAKNLDTGETFCSIQAAIDDSDTVAGHTIQVYPGVHTENVIVNKSVTLEGANAGISPNQPGTPLNPNPARVAETEMAMTGGGGAFRIGAADVTIDGFKFTDSAVDQTNVQSPIIGAGWNYGGDAPGVKIINNLFSETNRNLVYFNGPVLMQGGTVEDNRAQNPGRPNTGCGTAPALAPSNCAHQLFNLWSTEDLSFQRNVTIAAPGSGDRIRTLNISRSVDSLIADNTVRYTCTYVCFNIASDIGGDVEVTGNDLVTDVGNVIQIHSTWTTQGAAVNVHHNILTTGNDFPIVVDDLDADLDNVHINRNAITGTYHARNGKDDLTVQGAETLDVTCNWWGSAAGPNPANFFGPNDWTPWLYSSDLDGPCYVGGTISIDKVAPGGGATQFTFDVSWSANHVMLTDAAAPYVTTPPLPAGPYTITEINNPTGWSQQSATCDNAVTPAPETVNPSAITVADGDAWLCTFTNSYTPPPANTCPVGAASNQWTDLLGIGMGSPKKHKASAKLTIPNATNLVDLYGQLVAKNNGAAKYVRFIMKGKNNYVEVNTVTGPAEQLGGTFWYGADLPTANTTYVTGKWFLQKGGTKNHIPRAFLLYPTYNDTAHTYVNTWDTFTPAEGEVDWNVAAGWTPYREIIVPITAPLGPETFHVELALVDNDKDTRPVWVTVTAGGVTQTVQPTNPSNGDTLNLLVFDLANVPAGTDEIVIEVYSPSMALDGIIGDSAALVGMTANYQCSPLSN